MRKAELALLACGHLDEFLPGEKDCYRWVGYITMCQQCGVRIHKIVAVVPGYVL